LKRWFHESAEIAFSGCQNAEDLVTLGFTTRQNGKIWVEECQVSTIPRVSELGKIAFSGPQNEENLLDCFHQ